MFEHHSYPTAQHQVVYQQVVRAPSNGQAVTALVLGLVAISLGIWIPIPIIGLFMMFLAFIPAVLAIVFGHLGHRLAGTVRVGRGAAITGLVLGYTVLGLSVMTTGIWILAAAGSAGAAQ